MGDEKGLYSITELDPSDYESMISIAICEGQRNVVTWAREHGVARDVRNIRNAVCNGDLNMLKWLRESDRFSVGWGSDQICSNLWPSPYRDMGPREWLPGAPLTLVVTIIALSKKKHHSQDLALDRKFDGPCFVVPYGVIQQTIHDYSNICTKNLRK
jgi:hypothetical protein